MPAPNPWPAVIAFGAEGITHESTEDISISLGFDRKFDIDAGFVGRTALVGIYKAFLPLLWDYLAESIVLRKDQMSMAKARGHGA